MGGFISGVLFCSTGPHVCFGARTPLFDYWSFAVEIEIWRFEIEKCEFRRFFFFNIDLTIIVLVNFHVNFRASSSVYSKRPAGILIEITLNLRIHLGSLAI